MNFLKRFLITLVFWSGGISAWALSLTPSIQSVELKPGESVETEVLISNTEDEVVSVIPTTKDWFVLPANKGINVNEWLKIKSDVFSLNPGESKKLTATIRAPKKAQGELVGMISFRTKTPTRTTVDFVLSGAVYLSIKGTEKIEGDIRAFTVNVDTESVTAGVLLRNTGNVHLRPIGILQIFDDHNQVVANIELDRGQPTYPGNLRTYMGTVKDFHLQPGKYSVAIELTDSDWNVRIDQKRQKFSVGDDRKVKF